jgi:hypothetical protein
MLVLFICQYLLTCVIFNKKVTPRTVLRSPCRLGGSSETQHFSDVRFGRTFPRSALRKMLFSSSPNFAHPSASSGVRKI